MRILLTITLLFTGFLSSLLAQNEHEKALELYKQRKYADALVMLEESIATHPDWWFPILLKGQCNMKLKKHTAALANLNDALTLEVPSKEIPKVKYYIAKTYMAMKDYNKAIYAYTELLALVPRSRHFDIYLNRGQCEMQIAQAIEGKNSGKANSYYSKAVVSFSEALKNVSNNKNLEIEAAFQKAYAQYKIGNLKGGIQSLEVSIKAFTDVIRRNPKEERAHKFKIDLAFQLAQKTNGTRKAGEFNKVVGYIDDFLTHWPKKPSMINKKGQALQGAKRYKEAVDIFNSAIKLSPNDGSLYFSLGSCEMAAKRYKPALRTFKIALARGEKKNPSVYSYMAYCYQQQKTSCYNTDIPLYQEAVKTLEKGVGATTGPGKKALRVDLERKRDNLMILQDNLSTDEQNHQAAIDNIANLVKTLGRNRATLGKNREMYIQQPTEELSSAISAGETAIKADETTMSKELKTLSGYIADAKKCGGGRTFKHYAEMVKVLNDNMK